MRYSVGYQMADENNCRFVESLLPFKQHIAEVYFPWVNTPSGRNIINNEYGSVNWETQKILEDDLELLKENGIRLNLLFNANCYGEQAVSDYMQNYVCSILDYLTDKIGGVDGITTTSPFVAYITKKFFSHIKTRASVNTHIGSIEAMEYIAEYFDEYYMQRDFNRNFTYIDKMKKWADSHGKRLSILVNSGCMKLCSGQTFHDNLVSHENGMTSFKNTNGFCSSICWKYLGKEENQYKLLKNTWIRPEDIHYYENYFDTVKLATRMTSRPITVIKAYIDQNYRGNLLDLFEPNYSKLLGEKYISNKQFPVNWMEDCLKFNDIDSDYFKEVYKKVIISI